MSDTRTSGDSGNPYRRSQQPGRPGTRFKQPSGSRAASPRPMQSSRTPGASAPRTRLATPNPYGASARRRRRALPVVVALVVIVLLGIGFFGFALPAILGGGACEVESGQAVRVEVPEGASGDVIAQALSEAHVVDDPKDYYAAVESLDAAQGIKPGKYDLTTHMDPEEVVRQLVAGSNVEGMKLTVQEGLTVEQTAEQVEGSLGIPADEFLAQAKASNYSADYPFLEGAYDDSLEGYLYPKTYEFEEGATADDVIRALLDQFVLETEGLGLDEGANGLSGQEIVSLASLIERETAQEDERPLVASVIYNRLEMGMKLQIDAAIVYARGGGSDSITSSELQMDSPYNLYQHEGLTPGPICSPSVSSIKAALEPADTDYIYYVVNDLDARTHAFSSDEAQFEQDRQRYYELRDAKNGS